MSDQAAASRSSPIHRQPGAFVELVAPLALPHDEQAERAVLASCVLDGTKIPAVRQRLREPDLFILAHRHIYHAILALHDAGLPADPVTIEDELHRQGIPPEEYGNTFGLHDVCFAVESAANALHYADIVIRASERRIFLRLGSQIEQAASDPTVSPDDLHSRLASATRAAAQRRATTSGIEWRGTLDILAPVPPVNWRVPGLHLAPGRPCIVAGYGASLKTLACQALAIAAAAGLPAWGHFHIPAPLRVRHIDAEQGEGATRRRYRRLAFAANIDHESLAGRLELASFPPILLSGRGAEAAWSKVADGADIVLIDSLRAMTPGMDENSSEMRRYLDPLTRISEATGACFLIIHHAAKSPTDPHSTRREARQQLRGSSGIFDAAGSVFLLSGNGNGPRKVEQVKAPADAEGGAIEPFWLTAEDVAGLHDDREGVQVIHHAECPASDTQEAPSARVDMVRSRLLTLIQERPGLSARAIREAVGVRPALSIDVLRQLVDEGRVSRVVSIKKGGGDAYYIL
jgi:hypothetical protein